MARGDPKHLGEEGQSYQPGLTRRQYAERQCPYHEEGQSAGDRHPARHRRGVGFLSRDSTNPDTTAPRPVGHRRATPPACNNSRRVTLTTEWSRDVHRQWRPHRCHWGSREERRPSAGTTPSLLLLHQVWQQRRREQIPCSDTDSTKENDPKGRPTEET